MNAIITIRITKISVMAIQTPGAAAKSRHPSVHQALPRPEGTAAGVRFGSDGPG